VKSSQFNILVTCQIHKQKEMEENMKKFDSMLSFCNVEPHVMIEVKTNVKLVKMGGGGATV
jgi:hypothetical protein